MAVKVLAATEKAINAINKADQFFKTLSENAQDVHQVEDSISIDTTFSVFVPVRVISGNGLIGYTCDIFENGLNSPATKQGIVFLANGASTIYTLPAGTIMYAQQIYLQQIGSN